eukprot:TRINITY_DN2363_c0_g1_i8.p1 TRINITY_DN2363_c0_g1~~TRINITY_DN2363_c0_g1_i8.p1  ORF type:complete len:201 (+),score=44.94 TRINITY_DN2363_c0_g1_i8:257-859(+)
MPLGTLIVTNYKLCFIPAESRIYSVYNVSGGYFTVPLGLIASCEKTMNKKGSTTRITVQTKDGRQLRFGFYSLDRETIVNRLITVIKTYAFPDNETLTFAFSYRPFKEVYFRYDLAKELERMGATESSPFRIYEENKKWQTCNSYPSKFVVPKSMADSDLTNAVKHWNLGRVPAMSYYHKANGAALWRSSELLKVTRRSL